jgi:D-tagatose-1,6-bisphosphate aldolase subunit GatZ/KbaZ
MKNRITITEMMAAARELKAQGEKFTLLGIGPMSMRLIRGVVELAKERDFPVMLIASRNQVDSDEFGHGYVRGWDQDRFVADVQSVIDEYGFDGLLYLCRDHGGPWQRDEERRAKLPVEEAMDIGVRSYIHDMESGFDLLHIDPTKDPHINGVVPLETVLDRTVEIIDRLEKYRKEHGLPHVGFEAGTEETNGGLTSVGAFGDFVDRLVKALAEKGLNAPEFVVGQTGTLTRLTENVGSYNTNNARILSRSAGIHGVGLKEHNGDYLRDSILLEHPVVDVTAMNVAPEFGVVETRAYLELADLESRNVPAGKQSDLRRIMTEAAVKCERWRKWMVGEDASASVEKMLENSEKSALIVDITGHYTYEAPEVMDAVAVMTGNLAALGVDADSYVIRKIKDSVDRYCFCFGMYGLTSKLLKVCGK